MKDEFEYKKERIEQLEDNFEEISALKLNKLGKDGWELVEVFENYALFKRKILQQDSNQQEKQSIFTDLQKIQTRIFAVISQLKPIINIELTYEDGDKVSIQSSNYIENMRIVSQILEPTSIPIQNLIVPSMSNVLEFTQVDEDIWIKLVKPATNKSGPEKNPVNAGLKRKEIKFNIDGVIAIKISQ